MEKIIQPQHYRDETKDEFYVTIPEPEKINNLRVGFTSKYCELRWNKVSKVWLYELEKRLCFGFIEITKYPRKHTIKWDESERIATVTIPCLSQVPRQPWEKNDKRF